ncbi:hypothetical protein H632_c44p2 [Helicosporidium sp. ATCC 50920]|nr:hypothetical protein H632_c44p2 [Helicosporidium sp. ATCC 50920]|eukprot:KDD77000.1 hypothetical protein H632_c44p2 [Helicosporidium sp. ATCC 50920]
MSFMVDYFRMKLEERMPSAEEREKKWEERLRKQHAVAQLVKSNMELPTKSWGFWRSEKMNSTYELNSDPTVKRMIGRGRIEF